MRNSIKLAFGSLVAVALLSSSSFAADRDSANPQRGKKIYEKLFYKACGITCTTMAKKYSQAEWEQAYSKGKVQDLINKHCTIMEDLSAKEQKLIYDYMYYHANDSGHVAPCVD